MHISNKMDQNIEMEFDDINPICTNDSGNIAPPKPNNVEPSDLDSNKVCTSREFTPIISAEDLANTNHVDEESINESNSFQTFKIQGNSGRDHSDQAVDEIKCNENLDLISKTSEELSFDDTSVNVDDNIKVYIKKDNPQNVAKQGTDNEMIHKSSNNGNEVNANRVEDFSNFKKSDYAPKLITGAWQEFKRQNGDCFTKGCKWSPDGSCIVTNSEDNILRIFELPKYFYENKVIEKEDLYPEMTSIVKMQEGGMVYDYCWYPLMSSGNSDSCCIITTSQSSPIHMWDAFTGTLKCTYRAYDHLDEVATALSLTFNPYGEKIYCGFKNVIRIFDTAVPGRECESRNIKKATDFTEERNIGLISCICVNPTVPKIYAAGTYGKTVGLYSEPFGSQLCLMRGHSGGVTHLMFSPNGLHLFSGARMDSEIIAWDLRNPGEILFTLPRTVDTQQRIYFDMLNDGKTLVSGNTNGEISLWNTTSSPDMSAGEPILRPINTFKAHEDCVNGVSCNSKYPLLASSSGKRHFNSTFLDSDSEDEIISNTDHLKEENCLKLWELKS